MKLEHLSASTVDMFAMCPRKGYLTKSGSVPKQAGSAATELGRAVHEALETYHKTGEDLLSAFDRLVTKYQVWDLRRIADARVFLNDYRANVASDVPVIATEKEFNITIGGHPFKGFIDRLDYLGSGVYKVTDYKTSWVAKKPWEIQDDIQLRIYDIAVRTMYEAGDPIFAGLPEPVEVYCELYYLRHEPLGTTFSDQERADTVSYLEYVGNQIEMMDEEPLPRLNVNCRYCEVRGNCSLWSGDYRKLVDSDISESTEGLVDKLGELKNVEKALKVRLELIENMLMTEVNENGGLPLEFEDKSVELVTRKYKRYDWPAIKKQLPTWMKYASFDSKRFGDSATPEEREVVNKYTTFSRSNASVKVNYKKKRMQ